MTQDEQKRFIEEYNKFVNDYEEQKKKINSKYFADEEEWFSDGVYESYESAINKTTIEFAEKVLELSKKYIL